MSSPVVELIEGKVRGTQCKTENNKELYSFKSIPYAKPPIGELRFSAPQPPEPWVGIRDGSQNCNICTQFDRETNCVVGDEDCLYLNVYTPSIGQGKVLPVMVYFHEGGFVFGSGTDDSKRRPDYMVEKDVVIVSINYRLGILGFLSLDIKDAPGNMGLKDQVQALKWVQQNISKFSGDPNNVTIFGMSAGGSSVEYMLLSPMAKGLFHKAIAQSGSTLLPWALNRNIKQDLVLKILLAKGNLVIDSEEVVKYLKSLPIKDLVAASMLAVIATPSKGGIYTGFVPTIENPIDWEPFLDKTPFEVISSGDFNKVPLMSGVCSREGLLMIGLKNPKLEILTKNKKFVDFLPFKIDDTQKMDIEKKFKAVYLETEKIYKEPDAFAIDFFSDVDFVGGGYVSTSMIAKKSYPVYFYEFSYDGGMNYLKKKMNINREGACHGDNGGYLVKAENLFKNISDTDRLVRERVCEMWTNFAKYGNPTPKTDDTIITTKWEPIADTGFAYLHIDDSLKMRYEFYPDRMKLFQDLYNKYKCTV